MKTFETFEELLNSNDPDVKLALLESISLEDQNNILLKINWMMNLKYELRFPTVTGC